MVTEQLLEKGLPRMNGTSESTADCCHVLITGASSGIGAALASLYAQKGCRLTLIGRDEQRLVAVANACRNVSRAETVPILVDVTDGPKMQQELARLDELCPVDIVVANAGIGGERVLAPPAGEDRQLATEIFDVNVLGVINTLTPLLPRLVSRHSGRIAIVSSLAAFLGLPDAPVYAASKAAVRIYGHGLRRKLQGTGVTVTVICPGFVDTPMSATLPVRVLVWRAEKAAALIVKAVAQGRREVTFPLPLALVSRLSSLLPAGVTDFVLGQAQGRRVGTSDRRDIKES